jgi:hypothetical protein
VRQALQHGVHEARVAQVGEAGALERRERKEEGGGWARVSPPTPDRVPPRVCAPFATLATPTPLSLSLTGRRGSAQPAASAADGNSSPSAPMTRRNCLGGAMAAAGTWDGGGGSWGGHAGVGAPAARHEQRAASRALPRPPSLPHWRTSRTTSTPTGGGTASGAAAGTNSRRSPRLAAAAAPPRAADRWLARGVAAAARPHERRRGLVWGGRQ